MFDSFSDTVFDESHSNTEFIMLDFYDLYLEIAFFYLLSFLFFPPKGSLSAASFFNYLVPSHVLSNFNRLDWLKQNKVIALHIPNIFGFHLNIFDFQTNNIFREVSSI